MSEPMSDPCPTCHQPHPRCTAHVRLEDGTLRPCRKRPIRGATVCASHGGRSPKVKAAAARRLTENRAAREVARLGARRDIHPAEALIDLVHWTAGEVDYWRTRVQQFDDTDLVWGTAKHEHGRGPEGPIDKTSDEAKPHIAYTMLERASDRLAAYAAAALKAGVDERRVRLAETQGALVATVIRNILDALDLTEAQAALVPTIVPAQLRLITATSATAQEDAPA